MSLVTERYVAFLFLRYSKHRERMTSLTYRFRGSPQGGCCVNLHPHKGHLQRKVNVSKL
jgi:hypothetical protein